MTATFQHLDIRKHSNNEFLNSDKCDFLMADLEFEYIWGKS